MVDKISQEPSGITVPRIMVMGVGSSGCYAVAGFSGRPLHVSLVAVDTDSRVFADMDSGNCIQIGDGITHGFSAGGAVELGRQSAEKDSMRIRKKLRNVNFLILVAGLGGGTGSGALPVIARIAREVGCLVLVMASVPFNFEGAMKKTVSEEAMKRIRTHADAVIRIPNERLLVRADADLPAEEAFSRSQRVMQDGAGLLCRLLAGRGVCGLDFSYIYTMLRSCDGFCNMALGQASGEGRAEAVAEALQKHPLLGHVNPWSGAAGVVIGLQGGPDLTMREIQTVVERVQSDLPEGVWFNYGVLIAPEYKGELAAVALLAEQWKEALVDRSGRPIRIRRPGDQAELPLELVGKSEFEQLEPTIYNNQNLDVPTYIRREIKLPR